MCGGFKLDLCFAEVFFVSLLVSNHLAEEEKVCCFTLTVLWLTVLCVSIPHGALSWSIVYGCGISWSYSDTF